MVTSAQKREREREGGREREDELRCRKLTSLGLSMMVTSA